MQHAWAAYLAYLAYLAYYGLAKPYMLTLPNIPRSPPSCGRVGQ